MNHKHIHTKTSICSWSENPIKTLWGQAQLNKSTIEICFGTFDTHIMSSHIHVIKLSIQALQASILAIVHFDLVPSKLLMIASQYTNHKLITLLLQNP